MQHIINIAFDFDDKRITEITEKQFEEKINKIVENAVMDRIAPFNRYIGDRDWGKFYDIIRKQISEQLEGYKDEIIEKAVERIANSITKTKAFKEKVNGL